MEVHYGEYRITLFPQDIEEEMAFDEYKSGQQICSTNSGDKPDQFFEVIDKVVCLRVKIIQNPDDKNTAVQNQSPTKKRIFLWWKF
jgi:hypothetical protein